MPNRRSKLVGEAVLLTLLVAPLAASATDGEPPIELDCILDCADRFAVGSQAYNDCVAACPPSATEGALLSSLFDCDDALVRVVSLDAVYPGNAAVPADSEVAVAHAEPRRSAQHLPEPGDSACSSCGNTPKGHTREDARTCVASTHEMPGTVPQNVGAL